tara:strand:+ start:2568 stop:2759 length:192 start_codon:yes stop_codon:yes gene_type:complete
MNNFLVSIIGILISVSVVSLMGKFFDIDGFYYIPFLAWIIGLLIINMFLDKEHVNIFMKQLES